MEALKELSRDRSLRVKHLRVLLYIFGSLDWSGQVVMRQKTIAKDLAMSASDVSRAVRDLEDRDIIRRSRRWDDEPILAVSPNFVKVGSDKKRGSATKK